MEAPKSLDELVDRFEEFKIMKSERQRAFDNYSSVGWGRLRSFAQSFKENSEKFEASGNVGKSFINFYLGLGIFYENFHSKDSSLKDKNLGNPYDSVMQLYDEAIQITPEFAPAYAERGMVIHKQYELKKNNAHSLQEFKILSSYLDESVKSLKKGTKLLYKKKVLDMISVNAKYQRGYIRDIATYKRLMVTPAKKLLKEKIKSLKEGNN